MKTIQIVLAELLSRYETEVGERTARVARITELLASYETAVQEDAVTAIERLTGMPGGDTESVATLVAEALLREVQELPELNCPDIPEVPIAREPLSAVRAPAASPPQPAVETFPLMEARVKTDRLLIFGGEVVDQKCRWLEKLLNGVLHVSVSWVSAPRAGAPGGLVTAAKEGRLAGVIVLTELCAHGQFDSITEACQIGGVPHANGGRGGQGQLLAALRTMERWLGRDKAA